MHASPIPTVFGSENTADPATALLWTNGDAHCSALWRSERGTPAPKRVVIADDTMNADTAYRLACEGTALLWQGDFQNARQLLQALVRRVVQPAKRTQRKQTAKALIAAKAITAGPVETIFNLHRQAQAQRGRVLGMLLIPIRADLSIALRRAPDARQAFVESLWPIGTAPSISVVSLRGLLGLISAHEWRKKGVEILALGDPPNNRIHPHYAVFSPVRGEYVDLVATALKQAHAREGAVPKTTINTAFDIGTGSGVLAAVMARSGIKQVIATDQDPRALACAKDNLTRLGVDQQVQLQQANLFPSGQAQLIVCNPPWLPARPGAPIEYAVYDEGSRMLLGFLNGLRAHLTPSGEGWLIMSDLAEHLGLRTRAEFLAAIENAGLVVAGRLDAKPVHPKAHDATDPLHRARAAEVTSLWRLTAKMD